MLNYAPVAEQEVPLGEAITVLVVNESEATALSNAEVSSVETARQSAQILCECGPQSVAVTVGEMGVVLCDAEGARHVVAFDVAPIGAH